MAKKPPHEDLEQRVRQIEEELSRSRSREEALQVEKAYLEHLLDCAPEAIVLADRNHRITRTNAEFTKLFGYAPEETRGCVADDLIAPGDKEVEASGITRRVGRGEAVRMETVRYRKDRSRVFVELMAAPVRLGDEYVGDYVSYRDVTERRLAEEALRQSEERLREAQEIARLGRWELDLRTNRLHWSDGIYEIFEIDGQKFGASYQAFLDAIHPDDRPAVNTAYNQSLRNKTPYEISHRLLMKDGRVKWVNEICRTDYDSQGQPVRSVGTVQDITDLKRAEEALRQSEEKFRFLAEDSPFGISFMRGDRVFEFFNRKFTEIFGYTAEDLPDKQAWFDKAYPDEAYRERVISAWTSDSAEARETGGAHSGVFTVRCKDGQDKIIHFRGVTARDGGQFFTYEDITSHVKAQRALRESEEKYRLLVQNANDAIFIAQDDVLKFANPMTERLTGYSARELSEIAFIRHVHSQDRETVLGHYEKRLRGETIPPYSFRIISREGRELRVQLNGVSITWEGRPASLNFVRDITEQTKLEAQFQASQRLESLGTLAGGLAHDFNNILMGIQGRASLMLLDTDSSHPHFELLSGIEEHVKSAADLTRQLLGFARGGKYEVKPSDLNEHLKKTSAMFGRTKKEIRIHEKVQDGIWIVEIDQGQIQQVLMNLYVNAWQAMPGGGDLYLETENVVLDEAYAKGFNLRPGRYVRISVTDTGVGMDEKTKARLFEPFFTTKEMGRGTGLGLASSYGIIKNHCGIITVYSEKEVGTSFHVYLPASDKELVETEQWDADLLKGHETVLLVDDEEQVLEIGKMMLERLGYQVLTAGGGVEAVETFGTSGSGIDLVVLDMVMPDMGGGETFDRLKEISPDIKVLLSSGYSMNGQAQKILDKGCRGFIQKPFNMIELSHKVRASLDKPQPR